MDTHTHSPLEDTSTPMHVEGRLMQALRPACFTNALESLICVCVCVWTWQRVKRSGLEVFSVPARFGAPGQHPVLLKEAVCIHREAPKGGLITKTDY